jgi:Cu-Zn family superoxide dismutase
MTADENGVVTLNVTAPRVDLSGDRSVVGRSIIIHSDKDDLGLGGDAESIKTGNAGERLACGVITLAE